MTETQTAEVRRDHSTLLQAFVELGNETLGLREEYQKALGQVDAAREELAATRITLAAVQRERDDLRELVDPMTWIANARPSQMTREQMQNTAAEALRRAGVRP